MVARKYSRVRPSKAWSYSSFPLSRRPRPGMTAPPIARCGSTDTKAPTTVPSSSKAGDAEEFHRQLLEIRATPAALFKPHRCNQERLIGLGEIALPIWLTD